MQLDSKKHFSEPFCEVLHFDIQDILTTSSDDGWAGGEVSPWVIEKP